MSAIDDFKPAPADDYDGLLLQFNALLRLYNSTRGQCSLMEKTISELKRKIADGSLAAVESERAANAELTAEVEQLRARVAELEAENDALLVATSMCVGSGSKAIRRIKAAAVREAVAALDTLDIDGMLPRHKIGFCACIDELEKYAHQIEAGQ